MNGTTFTVQESKYTEKDNSFAPASSIQLKIELHAAMLSQQPPTLLVVDGSTNLCTRQLAPLKQS